MSFKLPQVSELEDDSRIERRHWGEIGSDEEESDNEEEDSDIDEDNTQQKAGIPEGGYVTPAPTEGYNNCTDRTLNNNKI